MFGEGGYFSNTIVNNFR